MNGRFNDRVETYFAFHLHTDFSQLDGFATVEEYLQVCEELGIVGLGITEHGNLYSAPYVQKEKKNYPSIKTAIGVELYEAYDRFAKEKREYFHLVAIAKNEKGRLALNKIITESNREESFYYKPRVDLELLAPYAEDLIISSACLGSKIAKEDDFSKSVDLVNEYKSIFPHFYLEMQSHQSDSQHRYNDKILKLAKKTHTPYVVTCDAHASSKTQLRYQAYHVKIAKDMDTADEIYEGCYLQSVDEIYETMIPQIGEEATTIGLQETLNILDLIEDVEIPFKEPELPELDFGDLTPDEKLQEVVNEGFLTRTIKERYPDKMQEYMDRVKMEMDVIIDTGFASYFLIVWDFVNYAKKMNMPTSDARGSAGGSLVLYLAGVTNIDPIKYGLIFERFLNKERINYPDIDEDFADQQAIISYLEHKYGEEKICRVLNFSYITPKVAIKDVGDLFGVPYSVRDEISKLFDSSDFDSDYELNKVRLENYILENPEYEEWFEVARHIAGKIRQTSIHACAVGILNSDVIDVMPVQIGGKGEKIIQCNGKMIEKLGIVKFDVLGVETLKVVYNTLDLIGKDMSYLDLDNEEFLNNTKAYDIIASGNTDGLFQIESYGMKDLFKRLNARNIEEISDGISLYRPDAMAQIEDYISVKNGEKNSTYIHEDMKEMLEITNGALIYQEQVLGIIRKFANRSYGQADIVRRAIGKKDKEVVQIEAEKLRQEILTTGYERIVSDYVADYLSDAGAYSFNKSHGVGYATLVYKTAFLKANHPLEYMVSLLNSKIGDFESINKYVLNSKQMGIEVTPPDVNSSNELFTISDGKISFGISMIKGVGQSISDMILEEREISKFKSFDDFLKRVKVPKGGMIALIKSGMFGMDKLELMKKYFQSTYVTREFKPLKSTSGFTIQELKDRLNIDTKDKVERLRLFNIYKESEFEKKEKVRLTKGRKEFTEKYMQNRPKWEFETLSMYLTSNPLEEGLRFVFPFDSYSDYDKVTIVGTVIGIKKKKGKNGQYAFIEFYNGEKIVEVIFWTNTWSKYDNKIKKGMDLAVIGTKEGQKVTVSQVKPYKVWCREKNI